MRNIPSPKSVASLERAAERLFGPDGVIEDKMERTLVDFRQEGFGLDGLSHGNRDGRTVT